MIVAFLPPRAGGGFLVEEEVDFRKFPDSPLPSLLGREEKRYKAKADGMTPSQGRVPTLGM